MQVVKDAKGMTFSPCKSVSAVFRGYSTPYTRKAVPKSRLALQYPDAESIRVLEGISLEAFPSSASFFFHPHFYINKLPTTTPTKTRQKRTGTDRQLRAKQSTTTTIDHIRQRQGPIRGVYVKMFWVEGMQRANGGDM
jgi:hypothetical protein